MVINVLNKKKKKKKKEERNNLLRCQAMDIFFVFTDSAKVCSTSEAGLLRYQVAWAAESIEDRPRS